MGGNCGVGVMFTSIVLLILIKEIHSFSLFDWFGSQSPRDSRKEVNLPNADYGECEWHERGPEDTNPNPLGGYTPLGLEGQIQPVQSNPYDLRGGRHTGHKRFADEMSYGNEFTAWHISFPMGSYATVSNANDGRSIVVRISGQGPFVDGRIMSLSQEAFAQIADLDNGVVPCYVSMK